MALLQPRAYTEADWLGAQGDPILANRELALILDTGEYVVGDGVNNLSSLVRYGGGPQPIVVKNISATSYTPILADAYDYLRFTNAGAVTVTIPTNASVAYPVGTVIELHAAGAGGLTVAGDGGVTVNGTSDIPQGQTGQYVKVATDTWESIDPVIDGGSL